MLHAGGNHKVFRGVVLENEPHTLHIVGCIAPVAQAGEVAQIKFLLLAGFDSGGGEGDFSCYEGFASAFTFVIKQDARAAKHIVGFAIFFHNPVAVEFCHGIGTIGVERRVLVLRHFLHLAVELAGAGLVDATLLGEPALTHCFQHSQHAGGIHIGSEFRRVETHLHMALCRQIVDFGGANFLHHLDDAHRVAHVGVMEMKMWLAF